MRHIFFCQFLFVIVSTPIAMVATTAIQNLSLCLKLVSDIGMH